jgi:predicted nucleotidyltransferase/uncharacterized protein with HEPN domain
MTQQELAERSGVRQPNIAAYENGRRQPSPAMLARLLDAARPRPSVLLDRFREQVLEIAARNHAGVRVFGSIARGEDGPESDVDLLVTFGPEASLLDQAGLVAELEDLLGAHVDVVSDRALKDRDAAIRAEAVPLLDLLEFTDMAARLVARGRAAYDADEALRLAAEAVTRRIGEAVSRLSEEFVTDHPQIEWRKVKGMRNIVTHEYARIDYEIVWNALALRVPEIAAFVRGVIAAPPHTA